ncbi:cysteine dioxygenase [Actinoalloteichus sp. AHMU CJ021]|uniref:cysteine dioxygenase n=1 Tax=Actinoalloteichus sp. AHMU CJ021 TaxID=2072503 RepID=UPI000CA07BB8|nr:cysteine dioxygenase [Actinoalloteichus sp. AHMU CJ021]
MSAPTTTTAAAPSPTNAGGTSANRPHPSPTDPATTRVIDATSPDATSPNGTGTADPAAAPPAPGEVDVHEALDVPAFRRLLRPDRLRWSAGELRDLTRSTALDLAAPLLRLARYVPAQRWWARLALTEGVEVWLLTWMPGQGTEPHDHGGAAGSFTVLAGEVREDYRYPRGPVRAATRRVGDALGFGAGRAHQVRNTGARDAVTVHAYSPPLVPTREYRSLADIPDRIAALPAPARRSTASEEPSRSPGVLAPAPLRAVHASVLGK